MALSGAIVGLAGCDPEGPGASGVISLGTGVDASGFEMLEIYAFANESQAAFDPAQPIPRVAEEAYNYGEVLAEIVFPFSYRVGGAVGLTRVPSWMLVAWLSHRQRSELPRIVLSPGDIFCAVPFRIRACEGWGFKGGDYCTVTPHVDCELAEVAASR